MDGVADTVLRLSGTLAVAAVFAAAYLESALLVGVVVPGETTVMAGGVLALYGRAPLWGVAAAATVGTILGDSTGYWLGRRFGEPLLKRRVRGATADRVKRAKGLMERADGRAVMTGRFIPALNVLIPPLAGTSRIGYPRFLAWNVPSGIAWGIGYAVLGYAAGAGYREVADRVGVAGLVVAAVVLVGVCFWARERISRPTARAR